MRCFKFMKHESRGDKVVCKIGWCPKLILADRGTNELMTLKTLASQLIFFRIIGAIFVFRLQAACIYLTNPPYHFDIAFLVIQNVCARFLYSPVRASCIFSAERAEELSIFRRMWSVSEYCKLSARGGLILQRPLLSLLPVPIALEIIASLKGLERWWHFCCQSSEVSSRPPSLSPLCWLY